MVTLVETLNYRCLRYVRRHLTPFHVLVGPNVSGKTTVGDGASEHQQEAIGNPVDSPATPRRAAPHRRQGPYLMALCNQLDAEVGDANGIRSRLLESLLYESLASQEASINGTVGGSARGWA